MLPLSNAWCELSVGDLCGRCPPSRGVGFLPPDPQRKGTDSLWLMWTPSSPHFTLRLMISATPIRQESEPAPKPPSPKAKSSPSPSSPAGPASRQRAGLLPLRPEQPHRCLPYAAHSLTVQPPGALLYPAHGGFLLAPGESFGGPEESLRSPR